MNATKSDRLKLDKSLCVSIFVLIVTVQTSFAETNSVGSEQITSVVMAETDLYSHANSDAGIVLDGTLLDYAKSYQTQYALGFYLDGTKIGWIISSMTVEGEPGHERAVKRTESRLKHRSQEGFLTVEEETTTSAYSLTGEGRLISVNRRTVEDGIVTTLVGERLLDEMRVKISVSGMEQERRIKVTRDTMEADRQLAQWLLKNPTLGSEFTTWSFNFDKLREETTVHKFLGRNKHTFGGVTMNCYQISVTEKDGGEILAEITERGVPLWLKMGILTMQIEPKSTVRDFQIRTLFVVTTWWFS